MEQVCEALGREAEKAVREIAIPPCPAILTQLIREMRKDDAEFPRITRLISGDVGLAATMLKTVNSPFYGLRAKAASVSQALNYLGLQKVAQLVTGLLLRQAFPHSRSDSMERFWNASRQTAAIATYLSLELQCCDRDTAHTFALFRDCGMPAMHQNFAIYDDLLDGTALAHGEAIREIENERYPTDHACLGERLARSWHLPDSVCQAILRHHDWPDSPEARDGVPDADLRMVAVTLLAEWLYSRHDGERCPDWAFGKTYALETLEISEDEIKALEAGVKTALSEH